MVFNEITKRAIEEAFKNPGDVDEKKVDAQQARRILDRLVGYKVSPLLWEKVRRGLSAGPRAVGGAALICEREREIKAFVPEEYWTVAGPPRGRGSRPSSRPSSSKKRRQERRDRQRRAGRRRSARDLETADLRRPEGRARERRRNPVPPFITSQAAAGGLQEAPLLGQEDDAGGAAPLRGHRARRRRQRRPDHLHAHRLDARLRRRARRGARPHRATYGEEYLPEKPNVYKSKKDAQDAHEAIRPTYLDRDPERSSATCRRTSSRSTS